MAKDWKQEIDGFKPEKWPPSLTKRTNPLTYAIGYGSERKRQQARALLRAIIEEREGRLGLIAEAIGSSWHVTRRIIEAAGLTDVAGLLRAKHGHKGRTHGQGRVAPRKDRKKD